MFSAILWLVGRLFGNAYRTGRPIHSSQANRTSLHKTARSNAIRPVALGDILGTLLAPVTLAQAFRYWLKLGFISFGGPAGQIALIHQELVEKRRWISEHRFLHGLNLCMLLPDPNVPRVDAELGTITYDIPVAELPLEEEFCSFDTILKKYALPGSSG